MKYLEGKVNQRNLIFVAYKQKRMEELIKDPAEERSLNFLEEIIEADLASGKYKSIFG